MERGFGFGLVALLLCLLPLICFPASVHGRASSVFKTHHRDESEDWGYVQVRPKAHLFYWHYKSPYRVEDPKKPWPIVLWLQGGPGASGVGIGNFLEVGPLDGNLKPRNSTWLRVADLLFVDNPVGTGYSFVEEDDLVVNTDEEAANDLTTLLIKLFNKDSTLQKSPLYFVAESYGGRYAVTTALSALKAIEDGKLNLTLGGVALGDSWISPEDFVFSWGPLLKDLSRLDDRGMQRANRLAETIKQQISNGKYTDATNSWSSLEGEISASSQSVDFYNFLLDSSNDPLGTSAADPVTSRSKISSKRFAFSRYSSGIYLADNGVDLGSLMDGPIKKKLKIPENVTWGGQGDLVFTGLQEDFMKPRINEVDELLAKGIQVTVYNGQLDLICATKGTEAWVQKLKWEGLKNFNSMDRTPIYCKQEEDSSTKGFKKSFKNFHFYWIFGAGHFIPVDQPCTALRMVANITDSPAKI
ncbi:hypothetical protein V2J09_002741 [Rumex salicifolius]